MMRLLLLFSLLLPSLLIARPLSLMVSVPPLQTLAQQLGGDRVRVQSLVRPGENPHRYEPTPKQIAALAQADLYLYLGIPFEQAWIRRIRAAHPQLRVLDLPNLLQGQLHRAFDPHIWTDPQLTKQMLRALGDALISLDPPHRKDYARRYQKLAQALDQLDQEIRVQLQDRSPRAFLVFHPAWGYFAQRYGLTQLAIEQEGKEPGPRALADLIAQARRAGLRAVFVQPQFNPKAAEQIARAIGGRVVPLDPLAPDYFENLRRVARAIAQSANP